MDYQRTNATYAFMYSFEPDIAWLRQRQEQLDTYRQQGLADTSRQVVSETLYVMGLGWMFQSELAERTLAVQNGILTQHHHRLGRMGQDDAWLYLANDCRQSAQQSKLVKNLQVVGEAGMKLRAEDLGGGAGFGAADGPEGSSGVLGAAAASAGEVEVVGFVAGLLEQQQRAGHVKLDVVRMRGDGEGDFVGG